MSDKKISKGTTLMQFVLGTIALTALLIGIMTIDFGGSDSVESEESGTNQTPQQESLF